MADPVAASIPAAAGACYQCIAEHVGAGALAAALVADTWAGMGGIAVQALPGWSATMVVDCGGADALPALTPGDTPAGRLRQAIIATVPNIGRPPPAPQPSPAVATARSPASPSIPPIIVLVLIALLVARG